MADTKKAHATEEQLLYANILNKGMAFGLLGLVITFAIYAFGIFTPVIPLGEVQNYWVLPVDKYLELTGIQKGWAWAGLLGKGDMLNFLPIAFLSGVTILCYLAILPGLLRKKDKAYAVLVILEVLVLCLAASGLVGGGAH